VFIGGGISEPTIAASMHALSPGGRLVAHAVTLESEAVLLSAYARHGGELVRLSVARAEPVGRFSGWRPAMPVTQWAWRKP
jgi:precorrin-6Y C5,15-methyltransferase (decarboxylating)